MLTCSFYAISPGEHNSPPPSINLDVLISSLTDAHFESVLDAWDEEDALSIYPEAL